MKRSVLIITVAVFSAWLMWQRTPIAATATIAERTAGYILLQVEQHGEAWYVHPPTLTRFYLGRPTDAFDIMRFRSLGITDANLAKIPVVGNDDQGDLALRQRLSGYILLQVEQHGEAWYVYPGDLQRYYLGRPDDAFSIMRDHGLGITDADLAQVPLDNGITYTQRNVATERGTYVVDVLSFDRKNPALKITTDTATGSNCATDCPTYSLSTYVSRRSGYAGIHGTYFCPVEYSSCVGQTGYYYYPVLNSFNGVMINADRIKYTTEPIVTFDTSNVPYFYRQTLTFKSLDELKTRMAADAPARNGTGILRAAISNGPPLVIDGQNVVGQYSLDSKQATVKSYRGALGWKGDTIYLLVVRGATVTDSAAVMDALGLDYALNLDGGGSTALYLNGRYLLGPGRGLANAIVITAN